VTVEQAEKMTREQREGKYVIGEYVDRRAPEFCSEYQKLIDRLEGRAA
jgi:2-oxoglutarate ferredoxin oxidoreductase subunit beta